MPVIFRCQDKRCLKNYKGKVKANTCYCIRTYINVNNAIKKFNMFRHTGGFVAKEFHIQFSFSFSLTSDTLIKAGSLPNSFLSCNRKNNVKYEVIKFEAPHNEVKNCIQEVL